MVPVARLAAAAAAAATVSGFIVEGPFVNAASRPANGSSAGASSSTDEMSEGSRASAEAKVRDREASASGAPQDADAPDGPAPAGNEPVAGDAAGIRPDGGTGAGSGGPDVDVGTEESVLEQLETLRRELAEEREAGLRAHAEAENVRRRAARDVEQAHRFGIEGLVGELLPVRDGLELGIQAAKEEGSTVESLAEGTEMTLRILTSVLEKFGAVEVNPEGEDFDPKFHQAMSMQEAKGVESGKVLQVFQKGCLLNGRVVRPAMVIVAK